MTLPIFWIMALAMPALCVVLLARSGLELERLRVAAVACACIALTTSAAVLIVPSLGSFQIAWPGRGQLVLGDMLLRINTFSRPLVLLPSALWLVTVSVTPRARLDRAGLQRTALATVATTFAFLTESPAILVLLWVVSNQLFLAALSSTEHRRTRGIIRVYLWANAGLLGLGVVLTASIPGPGPKPPACG